MPRNTKDFKEHTKNNTLEDNALCEQGNCKNPATKHSWSDGHSCTDCADKNSAAANKLRSGL